MTLTVVDRGLAAAAATAAATASSADGGSMDDGADIASRLRESTGGGGAKPKKARHTRKYQVIGLSYATDERFSNVDGRPTWILHNLKTATFYALIIPLRPNCWIRIILVKKYQKSFAAPWVWRCSGHIVVKFEEINLKFKKVRKSSRCNKIRKSLRSTFSHNRYRKTLSTGILNIVTMFSARMLIGQRSPTHRV